MEVASLALAAASPFIKGLISPIIAANFARWADITHLGDEVSILVLKLRESDIILCAANELKLHNPPLRKVVGELERVASDAKGLLLELKHFFIRDTVVNNRASGFITSIRDKFSEVKNTFACTSTHSVRAVEPGPSISVPLLERAGMSKKIKTTVGELDQICRVVENGLKLYRMGDKGLNVNGPGKSALADVSKVFGRKEETNCAVQALTGHNSEDNSPLILSIVGNGGIGKSTLAQLVYCQVEKKFDVRIWLRVNSTLDVDKLTVEILDYISNGKYHRKENLTGMQEIIRVTLRSKKVLLVVDNLSHDVTSEEWKLLIAPFERSAKIMTTTRYRSIAEKIGTTNHMELDVLKGVERWGLFKWCVFMGENPDNCLLDLGKCIMKKLKGYPLEVKTISAVLRDKLDSGHWNEVLKSDEWKKPYGTDKHDEHIMSSLEISFRYLPCSPNYNLQKCVLFFSLFPKNEKFRVDDLINYWKQDFIASTDVELGIRVVEDLVGRGFLEKVKETNYQQPTTTYYIMPELMHDLAKLLSFGEFFTIDGSDFGEPSTSVRHVSIITHSSYNPDSRTIDKKFVNNLKERVKNLEIEKLRTLMLIGRYDENLAKTIQNLFRNTKYLRLIRLSMESYSIDYLLPNISNSPILRYAKLESGYMKPSSPEQEIMGNLQPLSRLYQMETLDISDWDRVCCFRGFRLVSLQRIFARGSQLAMIGEVGQATSVEELREFTVKKKHGYNIGQLGEFINLRGSLRITNLENIDSKEEALKAKLVKKDQLHDLSLHCSTSKTSRQHLDIFEGLQPHSKLRNLEICGYGGITYPSWIDSSFELRSLNLRNWTNLVELPRLGKLPFLEKLHIKGMDSVKEVKSEFYGISEKTPFKNLKEMVFSDMVSFEEWVGVDGCVIFPFLKILKIKNCPMLSNIPRELYSDLTELVVERCENLALPCLPTTDNLKMISISGRLSPFKSLSLLSPSPANLSLSIEWNPQSKTPIKQVLDFSNLKALTEFTINGCPDVACLPWDGFHELELLKRLSITDSEAISMDSGEIIADSGAIIADYGEISTGSGTIITDFGAISSNSGASSSRIIMANTKSEGIGLLPKTLLFFEICSHCITGQQLSNWLLHLPSLCTLVIDLSEITCLTVDGATTASKENSWFDEGLLQIFSHSLIDLRELRINNCKNLCTLTLTQQGFTGFTSLKKLTIETAHRLLSSLPVEEELDGFCPFPPFLEQFHSNWMPKSLQSRFLSNLTCLKSLKLDSCLGLNSLEVGHLKSLEELAVENCKALSKLEGVHLLTSLKKLKIFRCGDVAAALEAALLSQKSRPKNFSLPLKFLIIDDTSFLTTEICKHFTSLEELAFVSVIKGCQSEEWSQWTVEQRNALRMLSSIRQIEFNECVNLMSLPDEVCLLQYPRTLKIINCPKITSLPTYRGFFLEELYLDSSNTQLVQQCKSLGNVQSYILLDG